MVTSRVMLRVISIRETPPPGRDQVCELLGDAHDAIRAGDVDSASDANPMANTSGSSIAEVSGIFTHGVCFLVWLGLALQRD